MSYSNSSGGTLTLPSPTNPHNVDVRASLRTLRRSLSRSPSKFSFGRTASQSSESSLSSPNSPSPRRITRPSVPASCPPTALQFQQPNFNTPFRSGLKLSLRSGRPKTVTAKPASRATRLSPKSPMKRPLHATSDLGNSILTSPTAPEPLHGQENSIFAGFPLTLSPSAHKSSDAHQSRHSMHLDLSGASKQTFPKLFEFPCDAPTPTASPLKRSDVPLHTDHAHLGSPVAKRRSTHGISSLCDSSSTIFNNAADAPQEVFDIHEDSSKEYELGTGPYFGDTMSSSPTPGAPRRTSSLRKSTLQQRHGDRSSLGRRQGERHLAQMGSESITPAPNARNRPRVSLDQFVQPALPHESPFSAQSPLPNPSLHMMERPNPQPRHPLSKTMTTSSSNSSMGDDSPTHVPVHYEKPRTRAFGAHPFRASAPVNARLNLNGGDKDAGTPSYQSAMPFQDAFKSTGLISKVNRNPMRDSAFGESGATMPDTPCKKPIYPSNTYPPSSGGGKRRSRHSFGSPSSPFASGSRQRAVAFGESNRSAGLFNPLRSSHARKNSMLSFDADIMDLNNMTDVEFPPTPTKAVLFRSLGHIKPSGENPFASRKVPAAISAVGFRDSRQVSEPLCKSPHSNKSFTKTEVEDAARFNAAALPIALENAHFSPMSESLPYISNSRAGLGSHATPKPLKSSSESPFLTRNKRVEFAKNHVIITASPDFAPESFGDDSPRTPQDSGMIPPDPSSLSISQSQELRKPGMFGLFPPATPTSRQGSSIFGCSFADRRMSVTPVHTNGPTDVDHVLTSMFDNVEAIGKGEFSQVFKVTERVTQTPFAAPMTGTPGTPSTPGTPPSPSAARLFAVKRIKASMFSVKACEEAIREVAVLKGIRGREHVLQFVESWERNHFLYIKTEYCEEGSLQSFLDNIGQVGRLDDFRIWKLFVEASKGVQSIHDAGFIHLDLKPANILINFEGTVKIGDFGMAVQWPVARGIDREGDRMYLSPEIFDGVVDKPADIFSLGLIVFEMATNTELPPNGEYWQKLRNNDLPVTHSLTWSESDAIPRDATGMPINQATDVSPLDVEEESIGSMNSESRDSRQDFPFDIMDSTSHNASNLFGSPKRCDLLHPPSFMVEADHPSSLDNVVKWMLTRDYTRRPTIQQVLEIDSLRWVDTNRRAGATVYEGNWGPQDGGHVYGGSWTPPADESPDAENESHDTEMMDV